MILLRIPKLLSTVSLNVLPRATYAEVASGALGGLTKKKKGTKSAGLSEKRVFPVETDANKLVNYVCGSNILKEGGEDIKLKPDEEYPDWLWKLRTGPAPKTEELDPNSKEYWLRIRVEHRRRMNKLAKLKKY